MFFSLKCKQFIESTKTLNVITLNDLTLSSVNKKSRALNLLVC
jgi:hypothetical protein